VSFFSPSIWAVQLDAQVRQVLPEVRWNMSHRQPGKKPLVQAPESSILQLPSESVLRGKRVGSLTSETVAVSCCSANCSAWSAGTTSGAARRGSASKPASAMHAALAAKVRAASENGACASMRAMLRLSPCAITVRT